MLALSSCGAEEFPPEQFFFFRTSALQPCRGMDAVELGVFDDVQSVQSTIAAYRCTIAWSRGERRPLYAIRHPRPRRAELLPFWCSRLGASFAALLVLAGILEFTLTSGQFVAITPRDPILWLLDSALVFRPTQRESIQPRRCAGCASSLRSRSRTLKVCFYRRLSGPRYFLVRSCGRMRHILAGCPET